MSDNITRFPVRGAPPDDASDNEAFSSDQIEMLGYALAGLKDELRDAIGEKLAAAVASLKIELDARLSGAADVAKDDLHAALERRVAKAQDVLREALSSAFEQRLKVAIAAFREETDLTVATIRSEILAKFDQQSFGLMLTDIDPRTLERSVGELKVQAANHLRTIGARIDTLSSRLEERAGRELGELRASIETLQSRLNSGERLATQRARGARTKDWKLDLENYTVTPVLANGLTDSPMNLKPMFEKFFDEIGGDGHART